MAKKNYKALLNTITTLIFDIDGVLTDSSLLVQTNGDLLRKMHTRDGYALRAAVEAGLNIFIISGGKNEGVRQRLKGLGIKEVILGAHDKVQHFNRLLDTYDLNPNQVLYMGDDLPDFPVMKLVGLPCCPQDAAPEIKAISDYISHVNGGCGAVRDVIEQVMKVKGLWMSDFDAQND
ncbi:HAD-IIIA family hydrolase [Flavobacteriaceae bacterium]|nr:HAD-IIIA family hydrolase [Flavobacteriaceae bacterium]MDB2632074.1 HAD-IIIA family hydrolase [Flavobacteriaceae bacterium]